jgi:membrane protein DedA with SNARE-associated domain
MTAESMLLPVPSEAVMPFAGFLAAQGRFSLPLVLLAALLGSLVGSLVSYALGAWGIEPALERWGKYLFVKKEHLAASHRWFERRGALAVFFARFVPGVRHVVSIPAGTARMPLGPFLLATALGAGAWNAVLAIAGYELGSRWADVEPGSRCSSWARDGCAGAVRSRRASEPSRPSLPSRPSPQPPNACVFSALFHLIMSVACAISFERSARARRKSSSRNATLIAYLSQ